MTRPLLLRLSITSAAAFAATAAMLTAGCQPPASSPMAGPGLDASVRAALQNNALLYSDDCITEVEVLDAQTAWGNDIVRIGQVYTDKGDYVQAAKDHIQQFYGYDLGSVLFKPTLAADKQFRNSFDAALSYFVGGNESYPEDKGFAIKPWRKVRWENVGIINNNCKMAVAMGNYYFSPVDGSAETKAEYTFAYVKDRNNALKISVHQSSVPFRSGS